MKILIASHFFAPSVGGIEQVSGILAEEFVRLGHEVKVVTTTLAELELPDQRYQVFRRPSIPKLFRLVRWCDVYLQSNISLTTFWPALLLRTPTLIVYHTWVTRAGGKMGGRDWLKHRIGSLASRNLAVSETLANSLTFSCGVIPNPYRDDLFIIESGVPRKRELVFLGRLVSDKGVDLLLDALVLLRARGLCPALTIVGTGPVESQLRAQTSRLKLDEQVSFFGKCVGPKLVRVLNQHQIMVVPSRWTEPFGLVALEGIACGLVVVGSSNGGLPNAIGRCGLIFETGNTCALADSLERLLRSPESLDAYRDSGSAHLAKHSRRAVAEIYLEELSRLVTAL